jgi:hypothetical protein
MIHEPLKSLRGHMRKFFVTLVTSLLGCSSAFAFWPEALDSNIEIGVGYRQDRFKWETSVDTFDIGTGAIGDSSSFVPVHLRSELEWKNLRIWQIEGRIKYVTCDNIYFRAYGDYGWITRGKNSDVDFVDFGSNNDYYFSGSDFDTGYDSYSSSAFSSSRSRSKKGHVYDASLGIGYQFKMCDDGLAVSPLVGYSWHGQHLNIHHGVQSYPYSFSNYSNYIENLHSTYKARWNGPWLGVDFDYKFCEWSLFASYEYHWAWYHASADWNLRTDLPEGFHHRSKRAYGQIATVGGRWDFCEGWSAGITGLFQWWNARHGRDRALFAEASAGDIETKCYTSIPLKRVEWCSASVSIDIGLDF